MSERIGTTNRQATPRAPRRDGSVRARRLESCVALDQWDEAATLAAALLHDRVKSGAVARYHCAHARHHLKAGDRSRALWEIGIALQTHAETHTTILEDEVLNAMLFG